MIRKSSGIHFCIGLMLAVMASSSVAMAKPTENSPGKVSRKKGVIHPLVITGQDEVGNSIYERKKAVSVEYDNNPEWIFPSGKEALRCIMWRMQIYSAEQQSNIMSSINSIQVVVGTPGVEWKKDSGILLVKVEPNKNRGRQFCAKGALPRAYGVLESLKDEEGRSSQGSIDGPNDPSEFDSFYNSQIQQAPPRSTPVAPANAQPAPSSDAPSAGSANGSDSSEWTTIPSP